MEYFIGALFLILSGIGKFISDEEVKTDRVLKTWKNKYKKNENGSLITNEKSPWYYFGIYSPNYKEQFPLSTTLLVVFTDRWHFGQFLETFFGLAIIFPLIGFSVFSLKVFIFAYIIKQISFNFLNELNK